MEENIINAKKTWLSMGSISFWNQFLSSRGLPKFKEVLLKYSEDIGSKDDILSYLGRIGGQNVLNCTPCQLNIARNFPISKRVLAMNVAENYISIKLNNSNKILNDKEIYEKVFIE